MNQLRNTADRLLTPREFSTRQPPKPPNSRSISTSATGGLFARRVRPICVHFLAAILFLVLATALAHADEPGSKTLAITVPEHSAAVDFERELLPVLRKNCLACHNKTTAKAGLILESPADIRKGGDTGPAAVAGKGRESLVVKLAAHQDKPVMPPAGNKVEAANLSPTELGLLQLWIDQGATGELRGGGEIAWQALPPGLNTSYAVALSPDGQFAACGRGNQIFVYYLPSKELVVRLADPELAQKGAAGAHRDVVNALAFSPDGDRLASGGYREVKVWRRPREVRRYGFTNLTAQAVYAVAASPDGHWLATGDDQGAIELIDLTTGTTAHHLAGHTGAINALQFSPDNTRLASAGADRTVRVWEVAQGRRVLQSLAPTEVNSLVWLPGGVQLVTGGVDAVIRIGFADAARGELRPLRELRGHEGAVTALALLPGEAAQLVSASGDGTVRFWDVAEGKPLRQLKPGGPVLALAIRPDGKRLATAGLNQNAKLWDVKEGKELAELAGDFDLESAVTERARAVTLVGNELAYRRTVWQAGTNDYHAEELRRDKAATTLKEALKPFEEKQAKLNATAEAKAAAEKALAGLTAVREAFEARDAADKAAQAARAAAKTAAEKSPADAQAVADTKAAVEAREKALADARAAYDKFPQEQRDLLPKTKEKLVNETKNLAEAETELKKVEIPKTAAETEKELAAKALATTGAAVTAALEEVHQFETAQKAAEGALAAAKSAAAARPLARALAFSADGRLLTTAGDDGVLHTWSGETGAAWGSRHGHHGAIFALAPAGGGLLASGAADRSALVWDTQAPWVLERTLGAPGSESPLSDRVNALRFSPDSRRLAVGGGEPTRGGEVKLWSVPEGRLLQSFNNLHSDAVFSLDFSPDGKLLASGAADRLVKVLDLGSGKVLRSLEGHLHHVLGVSWKSDGRTLASAGADNVLKIWNTVTGERKKNIEGFNKEVTSVNFIGLTDQALASSGDHEVALYKDNGERVRSFSGAADFVNATAATPDGKIVIAAGQDGVLRCWNGATGDSLATFPPPEAGK